MLSYASEKTLKISQKTDLLSLLKDLNSELKDKQYLIEVNIKDILFYYIIKKFVQTLFF